MLSLIHIKYFRDAALGGSLAAAARRNHVSPSAVSQAIRNLEEHFGCTLLNHGKSRFELTNMGHLLAVESESLLSVASQLDDSLRQATAPYSGPLTFATQQSVAAHLLPGFLYQLRKTYPCLQPIMQIGTSDIVEKLLAQRKVEFGLSVDNVSFEGFHAVEVLKGNFVCIESARRKSLGDVYLLTGKTRETLLFEKEFTRKFGTPPRVSMVIDSWGVILRFASQGLGRGLIPDYLVRTETTSGIKIIDLGLPAIPYAIKAFYPGEQSRLSKNTQLFLEELENYARGL